MAHSAGAILQRWRDFAQEQGVLHDKSRVYYRLLDFGMMIPAILLASVAGVSIISTSSKEKCDTNTNWLLVAMGSASILSSALVTIHRYTTVADLQRRHDTYADAFTTFSNELDMQLALDTAEQGRVFTSTQELIKHAKRNLDILVDKAPGLPAHIARAVHKAQAAQAAQMSAVTL